MDGRNSLFVTSDEHNFEVTGCAGHPLSNTPSLDGIAARGTRLTESGLFDLTSDVHESKIAPDPAYKAALDAMQAILRSIVDPDETDRCADAAQRRLIESRGGSEQVSKSARRRDVFFTPAPMLPS